MKRLLPFLAVAALLVSPRSAQGQGLAVTAQAGTLGLGGGAVIGLSNRLHLRGTFDFVPYEPDIEFSDIAFAVKLPTSVRLLLDLYPAGSFRLTGGVLIQKDVNLTAAPGALEIGGTMYTAAEVGTLTGDMSFDTALYGGIGFGNPIGRGVGVSLDLGIGVRSEPAVNLSANGTLANDADFLANLGQKASAIEEDATLLRYYPVISLAFSIGLGR